MYVYTPLMALQRHAHIVCSSKTTVLSIVISVWAMGPIPFSSIQLYESHPQIVNALTGAVDPLTQVVWHAVVQASS